MCFNGMSPPPPEAPRKSPIKAIGWNTGFQLIFHSAWIIVPLILFLSGIISPLDHLYLNMRGQETVGYVIDLDKSGVELNDSPLYYINIHYRDSLNNEHTGRLSSNNILFLSKLEKESPIEIEYDPEYPGRIRFRGEGIGIFEIVMSLLLIIGMSGFILAVGKGTGKLLLYRNGTAAQAKITAIVESNSTQNDQRVMLVHYSFRSKEGSVCTGRYKTVRPPEKNNTIWIIYDPGRPEHNIPA